MDDLSDISVRDYPTVRERVIIRAENEYEMLGLILTSTYIELNNAGVDAEKFLERMETE